ncbi:MAG: hypothetical protein R3C53_11470 [Pirellulaceae bacterium]
MARNPFRELQLMSPCVELATLSSGAAIEQKLPLRSEAASGSGGGIGRQAKLIAKRQENFPVQFPMREERWNCRLKIERPDLF